MDNNKLELSDKPSSELPATYKAIPEADMEEEAVNRPKSLVKSKPTTPEVDGADEKMLPKESVEVKTSPNEKQNGDAKLDIGEVKAAFVGLTKEELMKYANDPFWVRLRWFLFISFWLLWGLMLLGAIMIILAAPKCSPPPPKSWWEKGPLVEIEKTSIEEIPNLKKLSVAGVIIPSPEPAYSVLENNESIEKFLKTLKNYKDNDINVILELEPTFSDLWFNKSEAKDPEFIDFYIWQPPKIMSEGELHPPNNWVSVNNESSWKYSQVRKEYFYAPKGKPHPNFRNATVIAEFSKIIQKFLTNGVDGIRLKGVPELLVDAKFTNNSLVTNPGDCHLTDYCFYTQTQTKNLIELAPLLKQWRDIVKSNTDNGPLMIREDISANIEAYKLNSSYVVDLPIQSRLQPNMNVTNIANAINTTFYANNITWPLWKAGLESEWDVVTYLLPGTPLISRNALDNTELLKVRSSPSIMRGAFNHYLLNNNTVYAFTRLTAGNPGILVAFNPTNNRIIVNFLDYIPAISEEVTVMLFSAKYNETGISTNGKTEAYSVPISAKSSIVLSYVAKAA